MAVVDPTADIALANEFVSFECPAKHDRPFLSEQIYWSGCIRGETRAGLDRLHQCGGRVNLNACARADDEATTPKAEKNAA